MITGLTLHVHVYCQASSGLRRRADENGPDEEEFTKLANSVDEFSYSLLNPLKLNENLRREFADSLADIMDRAIDMGQKKVGNQRSLVRIGTEGGIVVKWSARWTQ